MKTLQRGMAAVLLAVLLTLAGCGVSSLPDADGAANGTSAESFAANGGEAGAARVDEGLGDAPTSGGAAAFDNASGETLVSGESSGEVLSSGGTSGAAASSSESGGAPVDAAGEGAPVCTLSISCAAALAHLDALGEKAELVPADGVLRAASAVEFTEGESVFALLRRVCRAEKIHMEFSEAPLYGSAYIEGIGNLYEFDCGEGSGWMYRVNGAFPRVGCSQYTLQAGDEVEWVYTCDFGADVGGGEVSG